MEVVRKEPQHGWIEVITGSMFSGKSEELIRRLRRAQIARQRVQIFKPFVDNRHGDGHIVSHSEMRIPSENLASSRNLLDKVLDTVPGIKGATASAQVKPATLETGLVVQVPPFVNTGDTVRVNTDTGEYLSRV